MALSQNSEPDNRVGHMHKCSDEYKVFINLNLTHLGSLIIHATDFISSLKKELLRRVIPKISQSKLTYTEKCAFQTWMYLFLHSFMYEFIHSTLVLSVY